jgi:hypothetical protein
MNRASPIDLIAYYLPQFHPIPENDQWWGPGFTEWTNVRKARPLFEGHKQPRAPGELGYYDLRDAGVRERQAQIAKEHGLAGFCYWHYWFGNGKRLLELPFDEVLNSGSPDFPFCLCWANQTWTGVWHGAPGRTLIAQTYPGEDDGRAHFEFLLRAFKDPRYILRDGRPLFLVYHPRGLPDAGSLLGLWRRLAKQAGFPDLFLVAMCNSFDHPSLQHFDAVTHFGPGDYLDDRPELGFVKRTLRRALAKRIGDRLSETTMRSLQAPWRIDYADIVSHAFTNLPGGERYLPCVLTGWDNTPRSKRFGIVVENYTPELLLRYLEKAIQRVADYPESRRIVFVKAWNEWAEGNYLEPDAEYGSAFLDVVKQVTRS